MSGGVALYERALTYNAKHAKALYNLGVACGEMGHVSRAIFLYELAIHFDPSCAEAWNNLGVLQRDLGNFEGAPAALHCLQKHGACCLVGRCLRVMWQQEPGSFSRRARDLHALRLKYARTLVHSMS